MDNSKKQHTKSTGGILSGIRLHRNYSQTYIAHSLGVSFGQYAKMERGEKPLTLEQFYLFARLFRFDPPVLLECLLLGERNCDEAVIRAISVLNNKAVQPITQMNSGEILEVIRGFIETKTFPLIPLLIKTVGKEGARKFVDQYIDEYDE